MFLFLKNNMKFSRLSVHLLIFKHLNGISSKIIRSRLNHLNGALYSMTRVEVLSVNTGVFSEHVDKKQIL